MQLNSNGQTLYDSNGKKNTMLDRYGITFYAPTEKSIGAIGTSYVDASFRGLSFSLHYDEGDYMAWGVQTKQSGNIEPIMIYYKTKSPSGHPPGLHFRTTMFLFDNTRMIYKGNLCAGMLGSMSWSDSNWNIKFHIDVDKPLINCYTNIDMHECDITNESDVRLKTNIYDAKINALDKINLIEMKEFDWIESEKHEDVGMIAQQLQSIIPDLVHEDTTTGKLSIKTTKFIPYLVKAIQELYLMLSVNSISTFALDDNTYQVEKWHDEYTMTDKENFIKAIRPKTKNTITETLEEVVSEPIIVSIN
jgi:hypothetical protein